MYKITNLTDEDYPIDKEGTCLILKPKEEIKMENKPRFGYNPNHIKIEEIKENRDKKQKEKGGE